MKQKLRRHFMLLTAMLFSIATQVNAAEAPQTRVIDNRGDKLFSSFYPNPGKETVILLHGGPGYPMDLLEVVAVLKERYQLITFHQRGTGKSPCKSHDYSMEAYLSDVEAVRQHYQIGKFHLWGHSWGGVYAQIYSDKYPEHLLSLFLCCPGSGTNQEWKQTEQEVMALNRAKCTSREWMQMGFNNLLGMLGSDAAYRRLFTQVMKNYNRDFINTDSLKPDLSNLRAEPINKTRTAILNYPVLPRQEKPGYQITIVYGDQDIYQNSKNFVFNRYPTASLTTIKNCGHIPWLHNPTEYNALLLGHFQ